jgi:hypothetical protein
MQERREAAAVPKRRDELESLLSRQSALEGALQERYKLLTQRLHGLRASAGSA